MYKALLVFLFVPALHAQTASPDGVGAKRRHAVSIVQHGSAGFAKLMQCFSCHDHALPMLTLETDVSAESRWTKRRLP